MSEASATFTVPHRDVGDADVLSRLEHPGRAFAYALLLALPLWCVIGVVIWAMA